MSLSLATKVNAQCNPPVLNDEEIIAMQNKNNCFKVFWGTAMETGNYKIRYGLYTTSLDNETEVFHHTDYEICGLQDETKYYFELISENDCGKDSFIDSVNINNESKQILTNSIQLGQEIEEYSIPLSSVETTQIESMRETQLNYPAIIIAVLIIVVSFFLFKKGKK